MASTLSILDAWKRSSQLQHQHRISPACADLSSAGTTGRFSYHGASLKSGNATVSPLERNDHCILGRITRRVARARTLSARSQSSATWCLDTSGFGVNPTVFRENLLEQQ